MIAHKQKKTKKKRVLTSGQLSADVTASEMGLKSINSNSILDPDYIKELVDDIRKFSHMLLYLKEAILSDCFKEVIHIRLDELLRVLKSVMSKHQNLNSVDLQNAAEMLTTKLKAVNFTEVNEENKNDLFREVFSSIETLAFTFGNILTNFLMGDVGSDSLLRLPVSQESKSFENVSVESVDSSNEKGSFSPIDLDSMLLKNTDSVELALSYAKTWSKYTKNIVSWVEKKLNLELESTRNIVKLAEATRTSIGLQEFMPLQSLFTNALLNDIECSHLLQQTIAALQANKFVQLETETALKKAKLLCIQRQDEYEKAKSSMFRAEEEHLCSTGGLVKNLNKQLEKKRRLEEEALQKVEEANELYKVCMTNVEERRNDLENTKREILTQLRKLVFQCDLTLKAVTVNLFQMQQLQAASLANNLQSLCDTAKLYDPGQEYSEFVKATNSTEEEKVDGNIHKQLTNSSHTSGYGPSDSLEDVVRLPYSSNKIEEDRCSNRDFHRKLPRTPSSGTMSSADDLDEREPPSPSEAGPNSLGTFKKTLMSKAALTHKFRKLRSPTKCRDCESIVVFQGVECEEGIYRVCGNKIKTEKLCQALENGMHLVDISEFSSHDICDVLKLYLRQYSNQARLVEFLITYSQKIFDGSLRPQDVAAGGAGGAAPQIEQGPLLKPLLSPEEKDPEHSVKSLFFSSKEDNNTADSESRIFESATSFEESERRQNALEKCDACLIDNKVRLLVDQELESASQKVEDVCKTSRPLTLKSHRETNGVERHTPRTKVRPVSLPVDRLLLLASPPNERSGRNTGNTNSDKFCKNPSFEGVNRKDPTTVCSKSDGLNQQTLQKAREKQYEQNDLTAKTALIAPGAFQERGGTASSSRLPGDHPVSTAQPSKPYAEPFRPARQILAIWLN
ncbi:rho GTPase-activating protein 29-like protein [Camelus ferus]|nr:rho GTPase-activating protein 29-like protein [Camelus ferus]